MAKVWVLDTETKGTGAQMVPLEKVQSKPEPQERPKRRARKPVAARAPAPPKPKPDVQRSASPLPPGHVRKKSTGELGRVKAVDAKAGTATVHWLRQGRTSTVPLTAISRR
jgi:hypothetical protein